MIEIKHLVKTFYTGESEIKAADNLTFTIKDGEFVSIVGRSGSGKSTLMHLIGGLDKADSGEVIVNGNNLSKMNTAQLSDYRAKQTGFVFQSFHLEPGYTVYDNIRIALMIAKVPFKEHRRKVEDALIQVGLSNKIDVRAAKLSGGEKQRVAVARALINDPPIILADEPCGNLDSSNSEIVMNLLKELNNNGKTVILVTHNIADAQKTQRIIELCDGVIIKDEKNNMA